MKRQKPVNTRFSSEKPTATKSLSVRYAELLKLRETIAKTETDLKISSNVERPAAEEQRAFPYH